MLIQMQFFYYNTSYWPCGSAVRASVFGWQTFPNLCMIYGWQVTTSWIVFTMGQPTRPTQPAISPASVNE